MGKLSCSDLQTFRIFSLINAKVAAKAVPPLTIAFIHSGFTGNSNEFSV